MIRWDWLSGTVPFDRTDRVVEYLSRLMGAGPDLLEYGQYRYDRQYTWPGRGVAVYFDSSKDRAAQVHAGRALVVLSGQGLGQWSQHVQYDLARYLVAECWCKATRLDVAYDDFSRSMTPTEVWEAACIERRYTRYKTCGHICSRDSRGNVKGDTLSFGTRGENGGGTYLRYYRKDLESGGEILSYRWEVEFSGRKAQEAFFALSRVESVADFVTLCGAYVGGSIDFLERREGDAHHARGRRLEWWQAILDRVGAVRVVLEGDPCKSVEKAQEWVRRSVVGSLTTIERALGADRFGEWLETLLDARRSFLTRRQMLSVAAYRERHESAADAFFELRGAGA